MRGIVSAVLIFICCSANAGGINWGLAFGSAGAFNEGVQQNQSQEQLKQCAATCQPGDGSCYQGCAEIYKAQQPAPQQYQAPAPQYSAPAYTAPVQQPFINYDYTCINRCTKAGYAYGLCQKNCQY